tara:strand:- start:472 stop:708 length:237 start_codon:yes stop_codon:yes gene_type:complete
VYISRVKQQQQNTNIMTTQEIINDSNEIKAYENEAAGWYALSRGHVHYIQFEDEEDPRYYKSQKSWAVRLSQLIRTGR